jgi:hypothetical protein
VWNLNGFCVAGDWGEGVPDMPSTSTSPPSISSPPRLSSPPPRPRRRRKPPREVKPYETQLELLAQVPM